MQFKVWPDDGQEPEAHNVHANSAGDAAELYADTTALGQDDMEALSRDGVVVRVRDVSGLLSRWHVDAVFTLEYQAQRLE